ncbi:MAG: TonB-dependent receptor [Gammaproteobacteria bacterium]|nr:TonB-dependent receptor [Gammaproteobacteria bacterium]
MSQELPAILVAAALIVLAAPVAAAAEDEDEDEDEEEALEEVRVAASRIGVVDQRVVVLDNDDLASTGFHPGDLLPLLPGFALATSGPRGSLSQARVRGAEANHLLVMIDGVAVNDPAAGSEYDFGNLDLTAIDGVEFLAGPQSAVWGSDAIAGVLHFDTTPEADSRRLRVGYGSHDTTNADLGVARVSERGHLKVGVGHIASDGTNAALDGTEDDGYANTTAHLAASREVGGWDLSLAARATEAEAAYDPSPAPLYIPMDGDRITTTDASLLRATARFVGKERFVPWLTVARNRTERAHATDGIVRNGTTGERDTVSLSANLLLERQRVNMTIEHVVERFDQAAPTTVFGDPNHGQRTRTSSVAAEYQRDLPLVSVSLSARADANSAFRHAFAYRLGATTRTSPRWFANLGRGVKNPTFIERFGYAPNAFIGNPDLQPETSLGVELGIAHAWDDGSVTLAVFDASLDDEIDGFVFDPVALGFTARNIAGSSRRRGAELTLDADWHGARWRAAYAYVDSTTDDMREIRRPRHQGSVTMRRAVSRLVSLGLGLTYSGASLDRDFSTYPATPVVLDGFRLLRADVKFQPSPRWGVQLLLENALDEDYATVYGYRSPGLSAMARAVVEL